MIENADIPGEVSFLCARIPAETGFFIVQPPSPILGGRRETVRGRCQKRCGQVGTRKAGKGRIMNAEGRGQKNAAPNQKEAQDLGNECLTPQIPRFGPFPPSAVPPPPELASPQHAGRPARLKTPPSAPYTILRASTSVKPAFRSPAFHARAQQETSGEWRHRNSYGYDGFVKDSGIGSNVYRFGLKSPSLFSSAKLLLARCSADSRR